VLSTIIFFPLSQSFSLREATAVILSRALVKVNAILTKYL